MSGTSAATCTNTASSARTETISRAAWLVIIVAAVVIRLPFALDPGLTGDEANYALIARCSAADILAGRALDPSNPPLFMLLLHGLMQVVGQRIWAWKLMTVAINVSAIALMVGVARRWVGAGTAILLGLLAAVHPWQVYMATEVRGYALAALWAAAALEAADRFERKGSIGAATLWALACAAGFWTHYSMAVVALATGVFTLAGVWRKPRQALLWCVSGVIAIALMVPWLLLLGRQAVQAGGRPENLWQLAGLPIVQCLGTTYLRPGVARAWLAAGALAAVIVFGPLALAGAVRLYRTQRRTLLLTLVLLGATVAVPLTRSAAIGSLAFSTRYTFVANVAMLLLVACGLAACRPKLRSVALVAVVALSAVSLAQFRWIYVGRSMWPEAVAKMCAALGPSDAVLFPDAINALRAQFFSGGKLAHVFVESSGAGSAGVVPPGADWLTVVQATYQPERFFTSEGRAHLHSFSVVWYWQTQPYQSGPPVLAGAYERTGAITLVPGGQFGAEKPIKLVRFERVGGAVSKPLPVP